MVENLIKKIKDMSMLSIYLNSGADIIDIGGESSRPGSKNITIINKNGIE